MDTVGYCTIKKDAKSCKGAQHPEDFIGKDLRVFEFAEDGGVLVLNQKGTALAMFDKEDVYRKFECTVIGEYLCPPNMNVVEQMMYIAKLSSRKGGWAPILKQMLIQASLFKGQFNDNFLFQKA